MQLVEQCFEITMHTEQVRKLYEVISDAHDRYAIPDVLHEIREE